MITPHCLTDSAATQAGNTGGSPRRGAAALARPEVSALVVVPRARRAICMCSIMRLARMTCDCMAIANTCAHGLHSYDWEEAVGADISIGSDAHGDGLGSPPGSTREPARVARRAIRLGARMLWLSYRARRDRSRGRRSGLDMRLHIE